MEINFEYTLKCTYVFGYLERSKGSAYVGGSSKRVTVLPGLGGMNDPPFDGIGEKNAVILKRNENKLFVAIATVAMHFKNNVEVPERKNVNFRTMVGLVLGLIFPEIEFHSKVHESSLSIANQKVKTISHLHFHAPQR